MQYVVDSALFDYNWRWMAEVFLYGIYINLFFFSLYALGRRRKSGKIIPLANWSMAILETTQIVLCIIKTAVDIHFLNDQIVHDAVQPPPASLLRLAATSNSLQEAHDLLFAANNLVWDSLLLYRCYVIWGYQTRILVVPGTLLVSTMVMACVTTAVPYINARLQYLLATATNFCLMILIAGRIWWIWRDAVHISAGNMLQHHYKRTTAMVLESGAMYCMFAIVLAIIEPQQEIFFILDGIATHLINIGPALIIVRVGLGYSIEGTIESQANKGTSTRLAVRLPLASELPVLHIKPGGDEEYDAARIA
ncbi:hypothetical protein C8F04DRAFT_1306997 [Mycena alexandri]|uniref:Uncharacterized protein n=1 Tax=Mycena alexandri TaxID=1745969 RepID=A0AAD6WVR5_9AGAR|nr:hypothetical protein C8F04DRAFT_1306997 [Mycena alexandri]